MVWLPDGEKFFEDMFIRFDRHIDTARWLRPRLDSIVRQKMMGIAEVGFTDQPTLSMHNCIFNISV